MREILFRGKRIDDGAWIYGSYLTCLEYDEKTVVHAIFNWNYADKDEDAAVDPETIGQFTGLVDKNGVKIFEGDILSSCLDDLFPKEETRMVATWEDYGWKLKQVGMGVLSDVDTSDNGLWGVIGNIYDNPELLEENRDEG